MDLFTNLQKSGTISPILTTLRTNLHISAFFVSTTENMHVVDSRNQNTLVFVGVLDLIVVVLPKVNFGFLSRGFNI
jgi:hypothetical protein